MTLKKFFSVLTVGATVALSSASTLAADSAAAITVTDLRVSTNAQIFLNTSDGWFWANTTADGSACPVASLDVRKSWIAMAQASLLSGHKLHIVYSTCASGNKGIREMWLLN